jgi:hypothetical protein
VDPEVVQTQGPPADPAPPVAGPPPVPPATFIGPEYNNGVVLDRPLNHPYWERVRGWMHWGDANSGSGRGLFMSDHCFDYMASPVTSPFYFEDPRALTELRPIFMYQTAPSGNPTFRGGNSEWFGTQARVAVTERLSFVINELGWVSVQPNNPSDGFNRRTTFDEVQLGPKYTFLRNAQTHTVMAAGLAFQIPTSSSSAFPTPRGLGLDPYLSFAQNFGRLPAGWGNFNFMAATGYSFGVDSSRAEFWHSHFHFDYNVAGLNRFYPFLELNWYHYTKAGRGPNAGFEGVDFANFGSSSLGSRDFVTLAPGLRFKWREWLQFGTAFEWPVTNQKEITDFRWTFDVIFRY